ncbi:hypothetical protein CHUAL_003684 [Chamberlinius hualienensis]
MAECSSLLKPILKKLFFCVCIIFSSFVYCLIAVPYLLCLIIFKIVQFAISFKNLKFLHGDDTMPIFHFIDCSVINAIIMIDGVITVAAIKDIILNKVINAIGSNGKPMFSKFKYKLVQRFGYLLWSKNETLNIDEHIISNNGENDQTLANKQQLKNVVNELLNVPLSLEKPPWEIHLIPYKQNTCVIFRVHHSITDGLSLFRLITELICGERGAYEKILTRMNSKFQQKQYKNSLKTTLHKICKLFSVIMVAPIVTIQQAINRDRKNILHGPMVKGKSLYDWTCAAKLSDLRRIKEVTNTTINDIITSSIAGALNKYMLHHGVCPPKYLHALVPVNFQGPNDSIEMRNNFSIIYPQLPTENIDRLQRLKKTKQIMDKIKRSPAKTINRWSIQMFFNMVPKFIMKPIIVDALLSVATILCSNKPGPPTLITLNELKIKTMFSTPQLRGTTGLGVCICSYADDLMVCMAVQESIIDNKEDLKFLLNSFKEEIQNLNIEVETLSPLNNSDYDVITIPKPN